MVQGSVGQMAVEDRRNGVLLVELARFSEGPAMKDCFLQRKPNPQSRYGVGQRPFPSSRGIGGALDWSRSDLL